MQIECKLKRRGGTKIQFTNEDGDVTHHYHFVPRPDLPGEPHMAEIDEQAHVERFLSMPEGYREHTATAPAKRAVPIAKPVSPGAAPAPAADPAQETDAVSTIRALSVRELKATINTYAEADLRAALAAEAAEQGDKPRSSWMDVIKAHLGEA